MWGIYSIQDAQMCNYAHFNLINTVSDWSTDTTKLHVTRVCTDSDTQKVIYIYLKDLVNNLTRFLSPLACFTGHETPQYSHRITSQPQAFDNLKPWLFSPLGIHILEAVWDSSWQNVLSPADFLNLKATADCTVHDLICHSSSEPDCATSFSMMYH